MDCKVKALYYKTSQNEYWLVTKFILRRKILFLTSSTSITVILIFCYDLVFVKLAHSFLFLHQDPQTSSHSSPKMQDYRYSLPIFAHQVLLSWCQLIWFISMVLIISGYTTTTRYITETTELHPMPSSNLIYFWMSF